MNVGETGHNRRVEAMGAVAELIAIAVLWSFFQYRRQHRMERNASQDVDHPLSIEPAMAKVLAAVHFPRLYILNRDERNNFVRVRPEDIPDENLRRVFAGVMDDLSYAQAQGDEEGNIRATMRLTDDEDRIVVDLYHELDGLLR